MIRVAIDGPAGVGKSSTSKALAKYFGFAYLDTGAMYRACAWWCLKQGIDLDAEQVDERVVTEAVGEFFTGDHFDIGVDPDNPSVSADGEDISEAIRSSEVSSHVSKVSNIIPVRNVLIAAQRAYIAREASVDSFSGGLGVVAEGRDITTVVAPDAEVRVLLTAREEIRQARRSGQSAAGVGAEDVAARDRMDSKVTSFMTAADGVTTVDNSDMDFEHTLDVLIDMVENAIEEQEYERYAANLEDYELDEGDEALIANADREDTADDGKGKSVGVLAIVGRPNVGKSSLLNQLAREERTVVNDLAGTTRDPVDEIVNMDGKDWLFIDTAGIKRRQHKLRGAEYYSSLRTQAAIERCELALVLFDASVPISDQDLKVMSSAVDAGRAIVLVFNKWDAMDEFDKQRLERLWATEFDRVTWAQRVNISAKTGWHTNRLTRAMEEALRSWDTRIPTGKLNAFLGQLQSAHPHPLRGGKQPRILFATQASTRPPRFVIFATGFLEHGYRRFIERSLREEFGFEGSPIQISVNIREKKKRK